MGGAKVKYALRHKATGGWIGKGSEVGAEVEWGLRRLRDDAHRFRSPEAARHAQSTIDPEYVYYEVIPVDPDECEADRDFPASNR